MISLLVQLENDAAVGHGIVHSDCDSQCQQNTGSHDGSDHHERARPACHRHPALVFAVSSRNVGYQNNGGGRMFKSLKQTQYKSTCCFVQFETKVVQFSVQAAPRRFVLACSP
eukprot:268557-Rhodomonas_salina.2